MGHGSGKGHALDPPAGELARQRAGGRGQADFFQQGDHGFGAFWAGSNAAQIRELEAADLINQLVLEMNMAEHQLH